MEVEAKGFVRCVLLCKIKPETTPEQMEQIIKGYSNLVNLVESLKSWHMGTDLSIENLQDGFTHVFELTFESREGIAEYLVHPAHLEFHERTMPFVEKIAVIGYKPTPFRDPN